MRKEIFICDHFFRDRLAGYIYGDNDISVFVDFYGFAFPLAH